MFPDGITLKEGGEQDLFSKGYGEKISLNYKGPKKRWGSYGGAVVRRKRYPNVLKGAFDKHRLGNTLREFWSLIVNSLY